MDMWGGTNGEGSMETYTLTDIKERASGICYMTQGNQTTAL